MRLETLVVGPFEVNCYLYFDEETNKGLIIDPGADQKMIFEAVDRLGFLPKAILLTHGHGDHIAAVADVKEKYDLPLYIGDGEEALLANPSANVSAMIGMPIVAPPPDELVKDEEVVTIGSIKLRVLATPGHSPGGVCYLDETEGYLFCGDTLFHGSIGRTDFPGCSTERLLDSIDKKIMSLPDTIVCYPGHGPKTTVGGERINNPFLTGRYFV
jgi:glyoxylase-like metal-dependent hydrolase (beta-lactamase superfamily II)